MAGTVPIVNLGYQSSVVVNGTTLGVKSGRVRRMVDSQECGDTVSGAYKLQKPGRGQMEASFEFYEKQGIQLQNPSGLYNLNAGQYISLAVYVKGVGNQSPYTSTVFLLDSCEVSFDVDGKVQGSMSGKSSGQFEVPTDG